MTALSAAELNNGLLTLLSQVSSSDHFSEFSSSKDHAFLRQYMGNDHNREQFTRLRQRIRRHERSKE